ncbi:flagellar basal body-associated protein FliL [Novosphingobium sp. P6W]|uniref:flagellar basal body-associated FliL family protein n=1 Tax=Novosphingobium sp. P6W TaxID=1609758 RepID=UPI0005C2F9E7|nr:flagellar basal body-associated FliL family protein [Novosphingobium sp. P6W]AXB75640.1 flagellar basal body-associated protein FliL [Novosphingobium sp. P6W]KIS29713.1 flagellar basal body-associated protein FliL [Novosphingobium sp. P6W]
MSAKPARDDGDEKPKKKGKMGLILIAVAMLVVGGGAVFGLMMAGVIGGHGEEKKKDEGPQLVRKGAADPYAPPAKEGEGEGGGAEAESESGDPYRTAYFTFTDDFTSNLKDSDSMVQASLACSTRRDGRVLQWLAKHELAIRSRLLEILADTPEEDATTIDGKERLNKRMTDAINQVLIQKEGFGGVDAVYFRNFIVQ